MLNEDLIVEMLDKARVKGAGDEILAEFLGVSVNELPQRKRYRVPLRRRIKDILRRFKLAYQVLRWGSHEAEDW